MYKQNNSMDKTFEKDQSDLKYEKNRKQVKDQKDTLKNLNFLVGKIVSDFFDDEGGKFTKYSTGCIIGPKLIITAAHAVFQKVKTNGESGKMLQAAEVIFIPNTTISPNNSILSQNQILVVKKFYMRKYKQSFGSTHDIAFLQLQQNSILRGIVGVKPNYEFYDIFCGKKKKVKINLVGYFTKKGQRSELQESDLELYEQQELPYRRNPDQEYKIAYPHTTSRGTSGAPIFYRQKQNDMYKLVGIHKGSNQVLQYNHGTLINILQEQKGQIFSQQLRKILPTQWIIEIIKRQISNSAVQQLSEKDAQNIKSEGDYLLLNQNYDQAIINYAKVIQIYKKLGMEDSFEMARLISNIGMIYCQKSEFKEAYSKLNQSVQMFIRNGKQNTLEAAKSYHSIGLIYDQQQGYELAIKNYQKSIQINTKIGKWYSRQTAESFMNIGNIIQQSNIYSYALTNYLVALYIIFYIGKGFSQTALQIMINIGVLLLWQNLLQQALYHFNQTFKLLTMLANGPTFQEATIYYNIGQIYIRQSKYKQALILLYKSLQIYEKIRQHHSFNCAGVHRYIAFIYQNQKQYKKSQQHASNYFNILLSIFGADNDQTKQAKRVLQKIRQNLK